MTDHDRETLTRQARADWDRSPSLRDEFSGDFDCFTAYLAATQRGAARVMGQGAAPASGAGRSVLVQGGR